MAQLRLKTLTILALLVALPLLVPAQDRVAVIIGINNYEQLSGLRAGVNDAEKLAAYYSGIGFKVWLMDDRQESRLEKPSLVNLQRVMDNVSQLTAGRPVKEMVFSFAGHGVQIEGQNWLCFPETQLPDRTGMLNVDTVLVPWLRNLAAGLTLVYLDACRNDLGPMRAAGVERGLKVVGFDEGVDARKAQGRNLAVFYAAKPGSFSYEKPDGTNGFFTDTLLEALQADQTQSVSDLYKYLRTALPERTEKAYGKPQIPNLGGDLDIAVRFSKGKVDLSALDTSGKIYVDASVPGAMVTINGIQRGTSPLLVEGLDPGLVTVEAAKDGLFASTQVPVTLKSYTRVALALERQRGDLLIESVRTKQSRADPEQRVDGISSFVKGMELTLDGRSWGVLNNALITDLEPGSHVIKLIGNGWTWASKINIKPREAGKLSPVFVPAATLNVVMPDEASLVVAGKDQQPFTLNVTPGTVKDFPPGSWSVTVVSRRFEDVTLPINIAQGGVVDLKPQFVLKPSFARGEEVKRLQLQIDQQTATLVAQRNNRNAWDLAAWIGVGIGGTGLILGTISGVAAYSDYQKYLQASSVDDANKRHVEAHLSTNWALLATYSGVGVIAVSLVGFLLGDHPWETQSAIEGTKASISKLEAEGVEY